MTLEDLANRTFTVVERDNGRWSFLGTYCAGNTKALVSRHSYRTVDQALRAAGRIIAITDMLVSHRRQILAKYGAN